MTDDPDSTHEDVLARILGPSEWTKLRIQVLEASVLQGIGVPLVKIGRFDAIVCIGEGGFGTVFKARDPELGRLVALKLCRTRSSVVVDGIMSEAKALAQLEHANIVTIFELGQHDGAVFFAMQYLAGKSAERFAERDPPPTWQAILDVYLGVASGLAAAHAKKFVHGDIKPSNILLGDGDFPYIADFGLAQRMIDDADESEQEELRHRAGTLYYMAPEVLRGGPSDALADQWSFCVSLCQTLARGKLPFNGESSAELLDDIEHTDVRELIDPSLPAKLQAVLRIGLSLDPRDRFPDMATLRAELERVRQIPPPSSPLLDEPEPDEPESNEPESAPDKPGRMHEPERMLPEGLELTPLGDGPAPSRGKRGVVSASLVLAVGLTLGWLGRGRVEGPPPSDPVPLQSAPCALGDDAEGSSVDIDPRVVSACMYIRQGKLREANDYWNLMYGSRRDALKSPSPNLEDSHDKLATDTMIVVQTYRDQAERLARQPGKQAEANEATRNADDWTPFVAYSRALANANGSTGESSDSSVDPTN